MESRPMAFPTPTSPLRRPDWLRESWVPRPILAPRLDVKLESEFDSEEVLRAILEVPSSLDSVAEEEHSRANVEHTHVRSFALSHSAPPTPLPDPPAHNRLEPSAAATSISSCTARSPSPLPSPAIPTPAAGRHASAGSPAPAHDHTPLPDPPPVCHTRDDEKRYTFGTAPTNSSQSRSRASAGVRKRAHAAPAPVPDPAPALAARQRDHSVLPTGIRTYRRVRIHVIFVCLLIFIIIAALDLRTMDVDVDEKETETDELGEVRAVTGHVVAVAATQRATRAAVQRHMPRESWTPPPQDEWSQAENGRWHLTYLVDVSTYSPAALANAEATVTGSQGRQGQAPY
ncbi:hypothetical protein EIP86_002413 [Pleurotus ostreatoroseus]|nr:hypothetical protein EIP86_002413 [Pleurotus ostreatoroseus]